MKDLRACYDDIAKLLGADAESYESVALVEEYRRYWRPDKVRIILLAESHVYTTDADREYELRDIYGLPDYPTPYAKFVYCLAYGEDSLTQGQTHPAVDGTPQFWKIFHSCMNDPTAVAAFSPVLKSRTTITQRIENKIRLLKDLKNCGVWLVDTSIMALYDGGKKSKHKLMTHALRTSWLGYTRQVLQDAAPEHVIIIGKGVAKSVEPELQEDMGTRYTVIAQPNAHLSAEQHQENFKTYYRICSS